MNGDDETILGLQRRILALEHDLGGCRGYNRTLIEEIRHLNWVLNSYGIKLPKITQRHGANQLYGHSLPDKEDLGD